MRFVVGDVVDDDDDAVVFVVVLSKKPFNKKFVQNWCINISNDTFVVLVIVVVDPTNLPLKFG